MNLRKALLLTIALLASPALLSSAAASTAAAAPIKPTDYHQRSHWLFLPKKASRKVDVFYVYPSEYVRTSASDPIIAPIDDPGMIKGAKVQFQQQATAFRGVGNVYAPCYRQADAVYALSLTPAQRDKLIGGVPATDGIAAFDYFIKHWSRGRPFILASHSQGSQVMEFILSRYMKAHPAVYKRMIAAYVIGYSVTPKYLSQNPFLKFAKGAIDTGVIVSWNTEAPTIAGKNPVILPHSLVINPITWTRTQDQAHARQNLGSLDLTSKDDPPVLDKDGHIKRVRNLANARIDKAKGVLICSSINASQPPYYSPGGFPKGVLHMFDYPLYFFDIRANAADRVEHYLDQQR